MIFMVTFTYQLNGTEIMDASIKELSEKVFEYCMLNAKTSVVQAAVKDSNLRSIAYNMKMELVCVFPELRGGNGSIGLKFGLVASEAFDKYKVRDKIEADLLLNLIDRQVGFLKLLGKNHPDFLKEAIKHDAMVEMSNQMQKPINEFLAAYKKIKRTQNKKISVVQRRKPF